jgi:hypothetical protein
LRVKTRRLRSIGGGKIERYNQQSARGLVNELQNVLKATCGQSLLLLQVRNLDEGDLRHVDTFTMLDC